MDSRCQSGRWRRQWQVARPRLSGRIVDGHRSSPSGSPLLKGLEGGAASLVPVIRRGNLDQPPCEPLGVEQVTDWRASREHPEPELFEKGGPIGVCRLGVTAVFCIAKLVENALGLFWREVPVIAMLPCGAWKLVSEEPAHPPAVHAETSGKLVRSIQA